MAIHLLPQSQYALYAVLASYAAIASPVFFQPFSKYVLVSGDWKGVGRAFYSFQPFVVVLVALVALGCSRYFHASMGLAGAVAIFALSQGWKEFVGELARVRNAISTMQRLYVFDALTTLGLSCIVLLVHPTASMVLLASGMSSLFWSIAYLPRGTRRDGLPACVSVVEVYRYAYGVVGTNTINSATISITRQGLMRAAPPHLVDAAQFLLDLLQKPMALIGSSSITAALPEVRRSGLRAVMPILIKVMLLALIGLVCLSFLVASVPMTMSARIGQIPYVLAFAAAVFIWSNRYKSAVMDIPLMSSNRGSRLLLIGATTTLILMLCIHRSELGPSAFMSSAATAMFCGGTVSLLLGYREQLIESRTLRAALLPAILALVFAMLGVGLRG